MGLIARVIFSLGLNEYPAEPLLLVLLLLSTIAANISKLIRPGWLLWFVLEYKFGAGFVIGFVVDEADDGKVEAAANDAAKPAPGRIPLTIFPGNPGCVPLSCIVTDWEKVPEGNEDGGLWFEGGIIRDSVGFRKNNLLLVFDDEEDGGSKFVIGVTVREGWVLLVFIFVVFDCCNNGCWIVLVVLIVFDDDVCIRDDDVDLGGAKDDLVDNGRISELLLFIFSNVSVFAGLDISTLLRIGSIILSLLVVVVWRIIEVSGKITDGIYDKPTSSSVLVVLYRLDGRNWEDAVGGLLFGNGISFISGIVVLLLFDAVINDDDIGRLFEFRWDCWLEGNILVVKLLFIEDNDPFTEFVDSGRDDNVLVGATPPSLSTTAIFPANYIYIYINKNKP